MLTKLRRWLSSRRALNQELNTVYRRLAEEKLRADQMTEQHRTACRISKSAVATLQHLGYTDCGGERWKPPLGPTPDFEGNVPYDDSLNELGWELLAFLEAEGEKVSGRVFNNLKVELKRLIEKWLQDHKD